VVSPARAPLGRHPEQKRGKEGGGPGGRETGAAGSVTQGFTPGKNPRILVKTRKYRCGPFVLLTTLDAVDRQHAHASNQRYTLRSP